MTFIALPFPHLVPILPHIPCLDCCVSLPGSFSVYLYALSPSPIKPILYTADWAAVSVHVSHSQEVRWLQPQPTGTWFLWLSGEPPSVTGWWLGSGTLGGSFSPPAPWSCPLCTQRGAPIPLGQLPSFCLQLKSLNKNGNRFQASNLGPCKLALEPFLFLKVVAI